MLKKGGVVQTDSHLELIMLGGEWRRKSSWEGEDKSLLRPRQWKIWEERCWFKRDSGSKTELGAGPGT